MLSSGLFELAPLMQKGEDPLNDLQVFFRGEKAFEACSPIMQPKIKQLFRNADFCKVIEECNKQKLTDAQLVKLLQQYPAALECLISTLMGAALAQTGIDPNGTSLEPFIKILNTLDSDPLVRVQDEIDIIASIKKSLKITDDVDEISLRSCSCVI